MTNIEAIARLELLAFAANEEDYPEMVETISFAIEAIKARQEDKPNKKLYAVTKGSYSDYHICALTADKENAEKLKRIYSNKWDDAKIEEYEDSVGTDFRPFWYYDPDNDDTEICLGNEEKEERVIADLTGDIYGVIISAPDQEHARKKALDMIAQYKAEKAGL